MDKSHSRQESAGSGVSLAEGSLVIHCVISASTGKLSKGHQLVFSHKLSDPLASCFFFLLQSGSPGSTGKHKACFISVDILFSRFVLGQTSYPITSTQVLHMDWWWLRAVNEPSVGETGSSSTGFVAQTQTPAQATRDMLCPLLLSLPSLSGCLEGGRCAPWSRKADSLHIHTTSKCQVSPKSKGQKLPSV